jgi:hypothetical protein
MGGRMTGAVGWVLGDVLVEGVLPGVSGTQAAKESKMAAARTKDSNFRICMEIPPACAVFSMHTEMEIMKKGENDFFYFTLFFEKWQHLHLANGHGKIDQTWKGGCGCGPLVNSF